MLALLASVNAVLLAAAASPWVYAVTFAATAVDGVFPPVPSETIVVSAAAVGASAGTPLPWLVALVAAAGAFAGDALTYAVGRGIGTERFRWMRASRVRRAVAWAQDGLARRGASLILIARYIPVGRVAVNLTAGATRYPVRRFLPLAGLAALAWAAYSVGIGVLAGSWLRDQPLLGALIGAGAAVLVGMAVDRGIAWRDRRRLTGEALVRDAVTREGERSRTARAGIRGS
ncbi:DedA family protein [Microbacterium gilvum]|uniref:VTT domain-containing protein n=1 Tax=Microbacterium gilvum TaxID=1336204 RepID=A0ABP8ZUS0_9MICO